MKTRVYVGEEIKPSTVNNQGGNPWGAGQFWIPRKWSLVNGKDYRFVVLNKKGGVAYGQISSEARYFNDRDSFVGNIRQGGEEGESQEIHVVRKVLKNMTRGGTMNVMVIDPVGDSAGVITIVEV
jgi:hypothetical protein